jgi:hypothetical protein
LVGDAWFLVFIAPQPELPYAEYCFGRYDLFAYTAEGQSMVSLATRTSDEYVIINFVDSQAILNMLASVEKRTWVRFRTSKSAGNDYIQGSGPRCLGAQSASGHQSYGASRGSQGRGSVEGNKDGMMQTIRDSSQQDRRVYVGKISYDA